MGYLQKEGITAPFLAKELKRELHAKETKIIKVKRNAQADEVVRQITESVGAKQKAASKVRIIHETTKEQVIAIDVVNWSVRQTARMDANKLRGDYAPQKYEHTGKDGRPIEVKSVKDLSDDELADIATNGSAGASQA
jgi:hypothetical protein